MFFEIFYFSKIYISDVLGGYNGISQHLMFKVIYDKTYIEWSSVKNPWCCVKESSKLQLRNCSKRFMRRDTVLRHLCESHTSTKPKKGVYCDIVFGKLYELQSHVTERHDIRNSNSASKAKEMKFSGEQQATKKNFHSYPGAVRSIEFDGIIERKNN